MRRNPTQMTSAEILSEVTDQKNVIKQGATRLQELSKTLHDRMRREPDNEDRGVYIAVSNVYARFGGMVVQGLNRTASADRLLKSIPTQEDKDEAIQVEERRKQWREKRQAQRSAVPESTLPEDVLAMYGQDDDEVISASR